MSGRNGWARYAIAGVAIVAATCAAGASAAGAPRLKKFSPPAPVKGKTAPRFDLHSLLVRFRPAADAAARESALSEQGARVEKAVAGTGYTLVATGPGIARDVARDLRRDPRVADVELNYIRHTFASPNDPLVGSYQPYLSSLRLPEAWDVSKGSSAGAIAILDTGVDLDHPDLAAHILPGYDFVNGDAVAQDDEGHGTMVAGIAAALTDNGIGVAGAAWNARIMPVKVLDDLGEGTDAQVAAGIVWAADHGARVINLSLGGPAPSAVLDNAATYAESHGAVVVAAAGNDGSSLPSYPAASPGVIAVAATGQEQAFAWFSNYGPWIDVAAPGIDIASTALADGPAEAYAVGSGTSFASPLVAGAAFLIRAAKPSASVADVTAALRRGHDRGVRGADDYYGAGYLDAYASLGGPRQPATVPSGGAGEPNGTPDSARLIGSTASGTISPEGDVDWYAVDLTADNWVDFTVTPPPASPSLRARELDPVVEVFGPDLHQVARSDSGFIGDPEAAILHVPSTGRYLIRVSSYYGSETPGSYAVSVGPGSPPPPAGFEPYENYPVGSWPQTVGIADVTGDGLNDVLLATSFYFDPENDYKLFLFQQLDDGSLADPVRFDTDGGPSGMATGDLDGDGTADVALATSNGIDVYYGGPGFGEPTLVPGTITSSQVVIADMNGDGANDLVVTTSSNVLVLLNTPTGFEASTVDAPYRGEIEVGDVTGDGRPDLVGFASHTVYVYAQNEDGTFAAGVGYDAVVGYWPAGTGLEVADVNGDGKDDVMLSISGNWPGSLLNVFTQTPGGTLAAPVVYPSADIPEPVEAADIDGDGRTDVVTLHGGWNLAGVYLQRNTGLLAGEDLYSIPYASHYPVQGLALGDFSGDGRPDIALADYNNGLVVLRQPQGELPTGDLVWVRGTEPGDFVEGVPATVVPTVRFARALDQATVSASTVHLIDARTGAPVPATVSYDPPSGTVSVHPSSALAAGEPYAVVVDGVHDSVGEALPEPFSVRFTTAGLDTTAPGTQITSGPAGSVQDRGASFGFDAFGEAGSVFECSLDGGAFRVCNSPKQYAALADGAHSFAVRAADDSGNIDPSPASRAWTVVAAPPPPPPPPLRPRCVVPNVKAMTVPMARRKLRKHHCSLGKVGHAHSRHVRKGRVLSQRPLPGRRLANGARVRLVVSSGPKRRLR